MLEDRLTVGYVPHKNWYKEQNYDENWNSTKNGNTDVSINPPSTNEYNMCVPINPCSNIYDLEIYDKNIDSLSTPHVNNMGFPSSGPSTLDMSGSPNCPTDINYHSIRYIGNSQPTKDELLDKILIKCRNYEFGSDNTYSNIPFVSDPLKSDESGPNSYIYNVGCISSPINNSNEINMEIYSIF